MRLVGLRPSVALHVLLLVASTSVFAQGVRPSPATSAQVASKPSAASKPAGGAGRTGSTAPDIAKPGYVVEAAPRWVVPAREGEATSFGSAPMHYRLIDDQVMVDGAKVWNYTRVLRVVGSAEGLAAGSQIEIEFDPSYQKLALHGVDVVRDGKRIGKIDPKRIQLLQRETQLERRIYDGRVTMSIVLDDVRVGDQIDLSYSTIGANPVFDGKFVQTYWMASSLGPVATYQLRVVAPSGRALRHRTFSPDIAVESSTTGASAQTIFRRHRVEQVRPEPGTPLGSMLKHQVHFSEFDDWAEVARWGHRLFAASTGGDRVERQAEDIRRVASDRTTQVREALQFVQREVRYLGTEIGVGTHRPAAAEKVMEQRFGDCKDKAALLVALLRRLGVEAAPVLVSTGLRRDVRQVLASPLAFDHVIVRVDLDGTSLWLDATRSHQTGTLANRQSVGLGHGLVLGPDSAALTSLPSDYDVERIVVNDNVRVDSFVTAPVLTSRVTYRGDLAEGVRASLANGGMQQMTSQLVAPYLRFYPKLQSIAPVEVEDSSTDNAVTLIQKLSLPDFWRFPEERLLTADVANWLALDAVSLPKSETRRDAYAFDWPGIYRQSFVFDLAEEVGSKSTSQKSDEGDAVVSLKTGFTAGPKRAEYTTELRIATDRIEPGDWGAHLRRLEKLIPKLGSTITVPAIPSQKVDALTREMRSVEDSIRAQRIKPVTRVQAQAMVRSLVLSAQIEGGRLAPTLEAQARVARGIQYDNHGRANLGRADFEKAMELAPSSVEAKNAAAVNAIQLGELDRALALSDAVLKTDPRNSQARNSRALAHYFKNELAAAQADFEEILKDSAAVQRGYPMVWLSLTLRQAGKDSSTLASRFPKEQWPEEWPRPLVEMALGMSTPDAVIRTAKASKTPLETLSEAYFYVGETYRADGDANRAREHWRKAVDQGVVEFVEHSAASLRLDLAKSGRP